MRKVWIGLALAAGLGMFGRAQAAPLEAYGKLPTVEPGQFEISPLGDKIAFVTGNGAQRMLVIRELTGKTLMEVPVGKNKVRRVRWGGEDHVLLSTSTAQKGWRGRGQISEIWQVVVVTPATHQATAVFWERPTMVPIVFEDFGAFKIDGKQYGYFGGVTKVGSGNSFIDASDQHYHVENWNIDLYRLDLDAGRYERVAVGSRFTYERAIGTDGRVLASTTYDDPGTWTLYAASDSAHQLMSKASPTLDIGLRGLGRRPDTVVVVDTGAEHPGVFEIDLAHGGARTELLKGERVDSLIYGPDHLLVGANVERDGPATVFFDPAVQAAFDRASKPFKGLGVSLVSADDQWKKWILFTQGDGDSGTYYLVDLDAGQALIAANAYPDIEPQDVAPVRVVHYAASDGLQLEGILTLPPGKAQKNLPVVVLPHGGPEAHDVAGFDWIAQAFAAQGYAVFQPNFRGSDSSIALRDAGYGEWGRKMQTDVSDGLAELVRQGVVDPKRACIVGASYGGYAALAGVTVEHGLYRCAVAYAGPADLNEMLRWEADRAGDASPAIRYWKRFMGAGSEGDPALHAVSPADLAVRADAPILLIHGKDDSVVPIAQSREMETALKRAGKPVDFVELSGEDHWLSSEATRVEMLKAAVEFVKAKNPAG